MPEVVIVVFKKLNSDLDDRLLKGGTVLVAGLERLVSDFDDKLLKVNLPLLLVNNPKGREVWLPVVLAKNGGIFEVGF